ncbi:TIGR02391 family protein [Nocardia brasiliensis]|uniref:TIGR02391 family protein n=1 Tax=Nocardia brasiliensis TaxID=37326 RepID=UPI002453C171|nr:TIGR02391 family protein [Nocardia brasiliensis]
MARREYSADARIPHNHHQDWPLIEEIEREMDRATAQWPSVEPEISVEGINQLDDRYSSLLDARIGLADDVRDVTKVTMTRHSQNDTDGTEQYLSIDLCKHRTDTSWVYVSGPVQATCDSLARRMQEYILKLINFPISSTTPAQNTIESRLQHLHPVIKATSISRLRNGHGDDALEEACKSVGARLRQLSGLVDQDGAALVGETLGLKKRLVALNDGVTQTDMSEQEGYMFLGMALFRAGRNPRAHRPADPEFDQDEIIEWLHVASAMHRALDRAKLSGLP